MRYLPYLLYLLIVACDRTLLSGWLSLGPVQFNLAPLLVLLVALRKPYLAALWFGFVAGLVYDAPDPAHLGMQSVMLCLLGIITSRAKDRVNLESTISRMLLVVIGLIIHAVPQTLVYVTSGPSEPVRLLLTVGFPGALYTALIGWIYFMVESGQLSYRRLRSMF